VRRRYVWFDPAKLPKRLRGAKFWQVKAALVEHRVTKDVTIALPIAAALDDDLRTNGYDQAVSGTRSRLLHRGCLTPGSRLYPGWPSPSDL
jgi:hypothetical protein